MKRQSRYLVALFILFTIMPNGYALRDPTRPPGASTSGKAIEEGLVLKAIIHSKTRNFAVINGKRLEVGDMIKGSKLLKIEKTAVYLDTSEGQIKLSISHQHSNKDAN